MRPSAVIAALVLLLVPPAGGADEPVQASATLHLRGTTLGRLPDPLVRYDVAARDFALGDYLRPRPADTYPSTYASLALDGRLLDGDLAWSFAADTGEIRRRRSPNCTSKA